MWVQIALFVINLAVSYYLRPEPPEGPDPASLEDVDAPTAEAGKPVPVLFGRRQIKAPNVVWYGDLRTQPIKKGSGGKK